MPVIVPSSLLTVTDLETYLHRTVSAKDEAAAVAAVTFALAAIVDVLGFDPTGDEFTVSDADMALMRGVGVRIAAQYFTNPEDRASYSGPEGLSYTGSPQVVGRLISQADRLTLVGVQLRYAPGFG